MEISISSTKVLEKASQKHSMRLELKSCISSTQTIKDTNMLCGFVADFGLWNLMVIYYDFSRTLSTISQYLIFQKYVRKLYPLSFTLFQ